MWLWSHQKHYGTIILIVFLVLLALGFSMCPTCRNWPSSMRDLADKRGLYNTRCTTMAKIKTLSKKKKDSVNSEFSEDILQEIMGSPSRMALLPGGKTHKGGSSENEWNIHSIGPPGTGHQSPGSRLHQSLVTSHQAVIFPITGHQAPVTGR